MAVLMKLELEEPAYMCVASNYLKTRVSGRQGWVLARPWLKEARQGRTLYMPRLCCMHHYLIPVHPAENQFLSLSLSQAVLEHLDPAKFPLSEPFPYKVR